jgi:N-acetylmuramoyl-L-alanine amidase
MIKIGISSGHNADNPNSSPDGTLKEWEVNLKIKLKIAQRLKINGFEYIDLNPDRYGYDLKDRADIANYNNVDAVFAVHCNALKGKYGTWGGIETFAHNLAPERGGKLLAKTIHNRLIGGTPLIDRGVKYADFAILRLTKAPAALGELAFMDNKKEQELLLSENYQNECATEIVQGLCDYFKKIYKPFNTDLDYKTKYENLKKIHTNLDNENKNNINKLNKIKDYLNKQVKEMDYVSRKYF